MADIVRVINKGDTAFTGMFESKRFTIDAGEETVLEVEAAVVHFGDWRARGEARAEQVRRVRGRYGCLPDELVPRLDADGVVVFEADGKPAMEPSDVKWERFKPNIEIYTLTGERCVTVIEDPTGESLSAQGAPEDDKEKLLQAMREQLERIESELELERAKAPRAVAERDEPESAPRPQRRQAKVEAAAAASD